MELQVLQAQFESHTQDSRDKHANIMTEIAVIKKSLEGKVGYKTFYWIIGTLISIQIIISGYMAVQISKIYDITYEDNKNISMIQGQLGSGNYDLKIQK